MGDPFAVESSVDWWFMDDFLGCSLQNMAIHTCSSIFGVRLHLSYGITADLAGSYRTIPREDARSVVEHSPVIFLVSLLLNFQYQAELLGCTYWMAAALDLRCLSQ